MNTLPVPYKSNDERFEAPVTVQTLVHFIKVFHGQVMESVQQFVVQYTTEQDRHRQMIEDKRANHRNFNRMLTLIFALMIGLVVTYVLTHGYLGKTGSHLAPYSFVITVLLDSTLALYSLIRRY